MRTKTKGVSFEVNCKDVVTSHCVKVRNMVTGQEYSAPAIRWRWRNSFYAEVTFLFRGQEVTVCAEVNSAYSE